MSLPTFSEYIVEALEHGPAEHAALLGHSNLDAEDAHDHDPEAHERLPLTYHHADAVQKHYANAVAFTHDSSAINKALIHGTKMSYGAHKLHEDIKTMHESAKPLEHTHHVYSSLGSFDPTDHIKSSGGVFKTPAYTSTTINPHVASARSNFHRVMDGVSHSHVIHAELPKGYQGGTYIGAHSAYPHEQEYLIKPGEHFKVHGSETHELPNGHKRTIWHVKPHDATLKEATYHDPNVFRRFSIVTKGKESGDMESPNYATGNTPTARKHSEHTENARQAVREDVEKQHKQLMSTSPARGSLGDHVDDIKHADAIHRHSISSNMANIALMHQHAGTATDRQKFHLHEAGQTSAAIKHFAKPTDHEMHVYSGLKHDAIKKAHDAGQTVVHMPAFTSTTIKPTTATGFASDMRHDHMPAGGHDPESKVNAVNHIAHFKIPKGYSRGVYVAGVSEHPNEKEYLLDKGQSWKITGHKRVNRVHASDTYGRHKEVEHHHIWTLEPHDDAPPSKIHESEDMTKKLDEAVRHSEHFFSGTMGFDKVHGHSALVKHTGDGHRIDFTPDHEELQKQHVSLRNSHKVVDSDAAHIIKKYTGNSAAVNKHLIAPKALSFLGNDHTRHADQMSKAIQRHAKPLRNEVHVYSGLGNHNPTKDFDKTGTVHLPAFTSTSLNPTVALAFGPDKPKKQETHILHFHLPKGYKKSLYVAGHSAVKDEREMLLDKGQKWQLTGVKKSRMKVEYGKNIRGEQDHHRDVTVWSLRPHHSQMNEAYTHDTHLLAHASGEATELDYHAPESNDHHHDEHLHLHALHSRDHDHDHEMHVQSYTNHSYDLNRHLITGGKHKVDDEVHELHAHLQKAISEAKPLEREHHVYSHFGINPTSKKMTNAEGHMQTPAYTSTSINPEIAGMHANLGTSTRHMAHFHLPKGYKGGLYVGGYSNHHEQEMLLGPNQRFQKTGEQTIHTDHDGYKTKTIVHSFKPVDHLHEAATHDASLFHDAHPEGLSHAQQGHGLPDKHVEGYIKQNGTQQKSADWSNARHEKTHQWMEDNAHEHVHLAARAEAHRQTYHPEMGLHTREVLHAKTDTFHDKEVNHTLHAYTEESDVNHHLVKKHATGVGSPYEEDHEENAHEISHAIKAHAAPLAGTLHTYSGMKNFNPHEHFAKHDNVIHTPAFTSTSINPHLAGHFDGPDAKGESHILHFELPHGYNKGAYIAQHSCHAHEGEFLLDKGQNWKLKNHETVKTHMGPDGVVGTRNIWTVTPHEDK